MAPSGALGPLRSRSDPRKNGGAAAHPSCAIDDALLRMMSWNITDPLMDGRGMEALYVQDERPALLDGARQ